MYNKQFKKIQYMYQNQRFVARKTLFSNDTNIFTLFDIYLF